MGSTIVNHNQLVMDYKTKLREVMGIESNDIVITIPKTIAWKDYEKELKAVEDYSQVMNFKVNAFPKTKIGSKCYLCYKDNVIGWMEIVGLSEKEFDCTTTGNHWKGKFIERSGPFHKINSIPLKGFRGFRYFDNINK